MPRFSQIVKGALSQGFCCVQINSVLKSLLSTFTHTQNVPAEFGRKYQMNFSRERKPEYFCEFLKYSFRT